MEAKAVAALMSLLAVLLVHALFLQRPLRVLADHLPHAAVDLRYLFPDVVDLLSRRNMILLCNAILLLVLRDAGLLASPARRTTSTSGGGGHHSGTGKGASSRRISGAIVPWGVKAAAQSASDAADESDGPGTEPATAPCALPSIEAERQSSHHVAVGEIVLAEGRSCCSGAFQLSSGAESNGDMEDGECDVGDVDEMNRRFEEFIANTRRKMQLESLQLVMIKG